MDELINKIMTATQLEEWGSPEKAVRLYEEVISSADCPADLKKTAQKRLDYTRNLHKNSSTAILTQGSTVKTSEDDREYVYQVDPYAIELVDVIANEMPISDVDYLAIREDIQQRGIQNPLIVLPDYRLLCGYTRLRVAKELGLAKVPVIFKDIAPKDMITFALLDNLKRRHLSGEQITKYVGELPILQKTGRPPKGTRRKANKEIAKALGVSTRTITRARSYARKLRDDPTLEGKSIREVLGGEASEKAIRVSTYTIGVDDNKMADDFVDIAENLFGFDIHPGDTVKMVIQAYHTKRG